MEGKTYEIQLFQGDHSNEYLLSEVKNGKIEGRCQLFKRGILSFAWKMTDDKRVGEITQYMNGKALHKETWDSFYEKKERRLIENDRQGLVMTIYYCNRSEEEDNEKDNYIMIYRGGYDAALNRQGYGVEYDKETGEIKFQGYWEKNKLTRIIREFDNNKNQMIEYIDSMNYNIVERVPIYIGEYCCENDTFLRNGTGYVIDELSGIAVRESRWEHGVEIDGIDLYDGWYMRGIKESIRSILSNEKPNEIQNEPYYPELDLTVSNSQEIRTINLGVTDLVISSKCGNELTYLDLNKFKWLQSIKIGSDCFSNVKEFCIEGLKRLHSLRIGSNSFTLQKDSYGMEYSKSFHILNCEKLESIEIGRYSFSDFAGEFELKDLQSLQMLKIGSVGKESYNFYSASLILLSRYCFNN